MPFSVSADSVEIPGSPLVPAALRVCAWVQRSAAFVGLAIGASNLFVWVFDRTLLSGFMVMRVNTAVGMTSAALSLFLWQLTRGGQVRVRTAQLLGAVVMLIGGLTALQDIFGLNLRIDELLSPGTL